MDYYPGTGRESDPRTLSRSSLKRQVCRKNEEWKEAEHTV